MNFPLFLVCYMYLSVVNFYVSRTCIISRSSLNFDQIGPHYSTVSETFISFTLTNVEFRKSRDFFAWILRGSSVGFAWN